MGGRNYSRQRKVRRSRSVPARKLVRNQGIENLLAQAGLGLAWFDSEGRMLGGNRCFRKMLGYSQQELRRKRVLDIFSTGRPETSRQFLQQIRICKLGKTRGQWRHKNGTHVAALATFSPSQESLRGHLLYQVLVQDVSPQAHAEAGLREARGLVDELERLCQVGSWTLKLEDHRPIERNSLTISEGLCRIFQYSRSSPGNTGRLLMRRIHPDDREPFREAARQAVEGARPLAMEIRIRPPKGEERILDVRGEIQIGSRGHPRLLAGTVQDITERKRAEDAVLEAKRFQEAVLDAIPINLAILDSKANVVFVNGAWRRFARANHFRGPQLGLGMNYLKVCEARSARSEATAREVAQGLRRILKGSGEEFALEYPCHSPREERWFTVRLIPFTFAGELRIVAAHLNVTKLIQIEKSLDEARLLLSAHAVELERRINKRTAELRETIHSLQGVLYHVAHDLRAPLRTIAGFSSLLVQHYAGRLDETALDFTDRIAQGARRMDALIEDLLSFGKACVVDMPATFVNLNHTVDRVLKQQRSLINDRQALVEVSRPLPDIWGNQWAVEQALLQLVGNALTFVPSGIRPHVRIWAELRNPRARVWIEDNGVGIPPEHRGRVFQIFERLNPNSSSTGIGLAIVRKIIERLDGSVGVEPGPEAGSRFWIELFRGPAPV